MARVRSIWWLGFMVGFVSMGSACTRFFEFRVFGFVFIQFAHVQWVQVFLCVKFFMCLCLDGFVY